MTTPTPPTPPTRTAPVANDHAIAENRRLWDTWTGFHRGSAFYDVASFLDGRRPIRLAEHELEELGPLTGKRVLHLQCHFGLDTLSFARLGAQVTGADLSEAGIAAARELATAAGLEATFVASNVYDLPDVLSGEFDIVYTSRGVLSWLPDLEAWARVAARYVAPGGFFYVTEIHPVAMALENEGVAPGELRLAYPYWTNREPLVFEVHGSYADKDAPTDGLVEHSWDHSLGEIVTAVAAAGLRIEFLHEFDFNDWALDFLVEGPDGRWRLPEGTAGELPLSFSLKASKPA